VRHVTNPTVIAKTISDFDSRCFEPGDKFRYAVIVPQSTLAELEHTDEYEYVRVTPDEKTDDGALAQILPFSDDHDTTEFSSG